jgi:hypothetical protein
MLPDRGLLPTNTPATRLAFAFGAGALAAEAGIRPRHNFHLGTAGAHLLTTAIGASALPFQVAETCHTLPFSSERVFEGLLAVLGPVGFRVTHHEHGTGRVTASAGLSARSWGEELVLQVQRRDATSVELRIRSTLKLRFNLAAIGKNTQNAVRITGALVHYLQSGTRDVAQAVAAAPPARGPAPWWVTALLAGLVLVALGWTVGLLAFGGVFGGAVARALGGVVGRMVLR